MDPSYTIKDGIYSNIFENNQDDIIQNDLKNFHTFITIKNDKLNIKYINLAPENLDQKNEFDIILNLEVVEHVEDLDLYLSSCFDLLKPGGIMFTATINRSLISYIKAIVGAEYILRWLPIGTHDWNKFLSPQELEIITTKHGLKLDSVSGMKFNLFLKKWYESKDFSVNYISTFLKN